MPIIIKLMHAHSPCRPIFINANRIQAIFDDSDGTKILFAHDSHILVKESPDEVVQLIQKTVADFSSQEPPPSSMWWQVPMSTSELPTPEKDMPLPSEGCVCGIHPHFDNDESDSLP